MIRVLTVCSTIVIVLLLALPIYAKTPTVDGVAGKLACYCGTCPHLVVNRCGCSVADQIKGDIKKMIDQGMTEDQIVKSYVAQYGETVLAAPPKRGFQLTAWAIPFAAFIVGGLVLIAFLKRQQQKPEEAPPATSEPTEQEKDEHYRKLLNDELEKRK